MVRDGKGWARIEPPFMCDEPGDQKTEKGKEKRSVELKFAYGVGSERISKQRLKRRSSLSDSIPFYGSRTTA